MASNNKEEVFHTMQRLNNFRMENNYCDVIICVRGEKFPAHRHVVAAACPFFEPLLLKEEWKVENPTIHNMKGEIFGKILNYVYTGEADISSGSAFELLKGANYLLMDRLQSICVDFLSKNCPVKDLGAVLNYARNTLSNDDFVANLELLIANNIEEIAVWLMYREMFQELPFESVEKIFKQINTKASGINYTFYACTWKCGNAIKFNVETTECPTCQKKFLQFTYNWLLARLLGNWIKGKPEERMNLFPKLVPYVDELRAYHEIWDVVVGEYTTALKNNMEQKEELDGMLYVHTVNDSHQIKVFQTSVTESKWTCVRTFDFQANIIKTTMKKEKVFYLSYDSAENKNFFWTDNDGEDEKSVLYLCPPPLCVSDYKLTTLKDIIYLYNSSVNQATPIDENPGSEVSNIYAYVEGLNKWFPIPHTPIISYHAYFVSSNDTLYVVGGNETNEVDTIGGSNLNIVQQYDPHTSQWAQTKWDVNLPLHGTVCASEDAIYIISTAKREELLDSEKNVEGEKENAAETHDDGKPEDTEDRGSGDRNEDSDDSLVVLYTFSTLANKWTVINRVVKGKFVPNVSCYDHNSDKVWVFSQAARDRVFTFDDIEVEEVLLSGEFILNGNGNLEIKDVDFTMSQ